MRLITFLVLTCCALIAGESESDDEPKDRYLSLPKLDKCNARFKEAQYKNRNFFFSGNDPELKDKRLDWLDSRNTCRERCMETVTFDSQEKFDFFKIYIEKHNISFFWTSGRLCDFDGCEGRWDLLPKRVKGWLWSANQVQLADTNKTPPEFYLSQTSESCIGILNNMYNDSIAFHDIACYHKTRFICEDSEDLLKEVLEVKNEESQDENVENRTKKRVVEVESTSRTIEVESTTKKNESPSTRKKIESENTSRRTKIAETTKSKVVNAKKPNQSREEDEPKKPQRRRKIVRKKLQTEKVENENLEKDAQKEETIEITTATVETENQNMNENVNQTDSTKDEEKEIEEEITTTTTEATSTVTSSTTRSPFRNRGRGRSRF